MSVLGDNYKRILSEIETKITDPDDLKFVKEKFSELSMIFMEVIDNLTDVADEKIKSIEEKQKIIEDKMARVESAVNEIESDIYEDDEENQNYEFEIVCPYCDHEFITEITGKNEIACPNCKNIIELDWNDDEEQECAGHCSSCNGCNTSFEDNEQEDNEDDM